MRFIKRLADRLRETNDQIEAFVIKDNTSRLVSILAKQVREQKKSGEYSVTVDGLSALPASRPPRARTILEKLQASGSWNLPATRCTYRARNRSTGCCAISR